MKLYRDLTELPASLYGGAITIGNFDGVHRGHVAIVQRAVAKAHEVQGPSVVFTFDPHPATLLRPEKAPPPLTWMERKVDLLGQLGIDAVVAYPTDMALLSLSPSEFFDRLVLRHLRARAVVEGQNFCFGRGRAGDVNTLMELCRQNSLSLDIVEPVRTRDVAVSSSWIRAQIASGRVDEANSMLLQPYRIRGRVTRGAGRGSTIGFPTANIDGIDTLRPGPGVYAGRAYAQSGVHRAAIHVGPNPTFGEDHSKVEVHLLDFSSDLYGQTLEVEFGSRLRDVCGFSHVDDLIGQLRRDVQAVRACLDRDNHPEERSM